MRVLLACVILLHAVEDAPSPATTAKGLAIFKKHVRPVLTERCLNCHGGNFTESELDLSTRAKLLIGGKEGPAIVPGKAAESLVIKLITHARLPAMPYEETKLPDDVIGRFAEWINLGAPYDGPLTPRKPEP